MVEVVQKVRTRVDSGIQVRVGNPEECWKTLAALIAKRACVIFKRREATHEEGPEVWQLAESQIEKPLCCGLLRLTGGWLVSLDASEMGSAQIQLCAEPRRLVLLGTNPPTGASGAKDAAVRVLRLPNEIEPESLHVTIHGPVIDIELRDRAAGGTRTADAA